MHLKSPGNFRRFCGSIKPKTLQLLTFYMCCSVYLASVFMENGPMMIVPDLLSLNEPEPPALPVLPSAENSTSLATSAHKTFTNASLNSSSFSSTFLSSSWFKHFYRMKMARLILIQYFHHLHARIPSQYNNYNSSISGFSGRFQSDHVYAQPTYHLTKYSFEQTSIISTVYYVTRVATVLLLIGLRLLDRFRIDLFLWLGGLVYAVSLVLYALCSSASAAASLLPVLAAARAINGIAVALALTATVHIINSAHEISRDPARLRLAYGVYEFCGDFGVRNSLALVGLIYARCGFGVVLAVLCALWLNCTVPAVWRRVALDNMRRWQLEGGLQHENADDLIGGGRQKQVEERLVDDDKEEEGEQSEKRPLIHTNNQLQEEKNEKEGNKRQTSSAPLFCHGFMWLWFANIWFAAGFEQAQANCIIIWLHNEFQPVASMENLAILAYTANYIGIAVILSNILVIWRWPRARFAYVIAASLLVSLVWIALPQVWPDNHQYDSWIAVTVLITLGQFYEVQNALCCSLMMDVCKVKLGETRLNSIALFYSLSLASSQGLNALLSDNLSEYFGFRAYSLAFGLCSLVCVLANIRLKRYSDSVFYDRCDNDYSQRN